MPNAKFFADVGSQSTQTFAEKDESEHLRPRSIDLPVNMLNRYVGEFLSPTGYRLQFYLKGPVLWVSDPQAAVYAELIAIAKDHFTVVPLTDYEYKFDLEVGALMAIDGQLSIDLERTLN